MSARARALRRTFTTLGALASVSGCALDASVGWESPTADAATPDANAARADVDASTPDAGAAIADAQDAGATWHAVPSDTTAHLRAVSGSGPSDVWAVGDLGTAIHWDGSSWRPSATGTTEQLAAVWSSGGADVWAAGESCTLLHWTGAAWSRATGLPCAGAIRGLWGSDASQVWAVGGDAASRTLMHWNGRAWSGAPSAGAARLLGVSGSDRAAAWAVVDATALLRWGGTTWTDGPGPGVLTGGAWSANPHDAWLTGTHGATYHFDGRGWTPRPTGADDDMRDVWGTGLADVWAVGGEGAIAHWDGAAWALARGVTPRDLDGVWGSGSTDVWAVGAGGIVLRYSP